MPRPFGYVVPEETKRRISAAKIGHTVTFDTREKISNKLKGRKLTEEHRTHIGDAQRGIWLTDIPKYNAIHARLRKVRGTPSICEECGRTDSTTRYEWAYTGGNRSDLSCYKRLCRGCHVCFDDVINRGHATKRRKGRGMVTAFGRTMTYGEWSEVTGIKKGTISQRRCRGYNGEKLLSGWSPPPEWIHGEECLTRKEK